MITGDMLKIYQNRETDSSQNNQLIISLTAN